MVFTTTQSFDAAALAAALARLNMFNPNLFLIRAQRGPSMDDPLGQRIRVGWVCRRLELQQSVELSMNWMRGQNVSPDALIGRLCAAIQEKIGQTVVDVIDRFSDPRAVLESMMPHFEQEIVLQMERLERIELRPYRWNVDAAVYRGTVALNPTDFYINPGRVPPSVEAAKKARALLIKNLNDEQRKAFEKDGTFKVLAKDSKTYTISTKRSFNVQGPDGVKYCGQLQDTPIEDQMLAQKLLLEHEPEKFFKNANKMGGPSACLTYEDAWRSMTNQNINALNRLMREQMDQIPMGQSLINDYLRGPSRD